jgi:hypothetical protein
MKSRTTKSFWRHFEKLPKATRLQATKAYRLWRHEPSHPSLHFKPVHIADPIYSLRVSRNHRALGLREGDTVTWSGSDRTRTTTGWYADRLT